jgi:hypothetical protein
MNHQRIVSYKHLIKNKMLFLGLRDVILIAAAIGFFYNPLFTIIDGNKSYPDRSSYVRR